MDEVVCRAYVSGDLFKLKPRADMAAEVAQLGEEAQEAAFVGWTLMAGERVLACAWFSYLGSGRVSLAACVSDMTARQWVAASRFVREKLQRLERAIEPQAISATCRANLTTARAYLERFGFVVDDDCEPPAPGYITLTRRRA